MFSTEPRKNNVVSWSTWSKQQCSLYINKEHPKLTQNLPSTNGEDSKNPFASRDSPGCSLYRGVFSWNYAPVGAVPAKKMEFGFLSLNI